MTDLITLWDWLITVFTDIWTWLYSGASWVGLSVIGLFILRRVVKAMRKIY